MAEVVKMGRLGDVMLARIERRLSAFDKEDPRMVETLLSIGLTLETQIKLNIRSQGLIDTGRLLNSIRHQLEPGGIPAVSIGSFGVPYAAIHEFGFRGAVNVRAHTRVVTQAYGRSITPVAAQVRGFTRNMTIPSRPYFRPAIEKHTSSILKQIQVLLRNNG